VVGGVAVEFVENFFHDASCRELARLGQSVADVEGSIVEIGSWEGKSTIALADAVHPRWVRAVDTWNGSPSDITGEIAQQRDIYAAFMKNIEQTTNIAPYRMGWRDFVKLGEDPVALLFIDAEHTYREVFDTIEAFLPLMSKGGVMCGDDAQWPPVREAIVDTLGPIYEVCGPVWSWRNA
jgi:predicted O-methyltransferase YrrM